jgi:hypothetical protein
MKKPRLFPDGAVVAKWKDHVAGDSNMVKGRGSLHPLVLEAINPAKIC